MGVANLGSLLDDVGVSVSDQQLLDEELADWFEEVYSALRHRHSDGCPCNGCRPQKSLDCIRERLTDLRAENDQMRHEREITDVSTPRIYREVCDLRAENNLFDERGRKLVEMTRRAMAAENKYQAACEAWGFDKARLAEAVEHARSARNTAAAPEYDEEAIRCALWATVDALLAAPQKEAVKPPKELSPMWESTDGGYSKEGRQKDNPGGFCPICGKHLMWGGDTACECAPQKEVGA